MKFKLIVLLLLVHVLKELVWLAIIPIWHFPDEEQHFGQVAFWVEKNRFPQGREKDINAEIDQTSLILGTKRDDRGINKFTYHPEYRIPYSESQTGIFENDIKKLNTKDYRQTMIKQEASRYGPFYYILAGIPYQLFYQSDLLVRVFASRIVSVILSTLTVLLAYLIARQVIKKEFISLVIAGLVSFQAMFSFVSAGINSDNLFNLIFSLIIYFSLKTFFNKKMNVKYLLLLLMTAISGYYCKKQIVISIPIIIIGYLLGIFLKEKKLRKYYLLALAVIVILLFLFTKGKINIPEYHPLSQSKLQESFLEYIYWHLRHTVAETIPWYWGVFNWLGVALPRWVYRIQARLLIVSALGLVVYLVKQIKFKKLLTKENLKFYFLLLAAAVYYLSIISWDYFFRTTLGFSFGIQGRYFFPTIIVHMTILVIGLNALLPDKLKYLFNKILVIWWIIYSVVGMITAFGAYYNLTSVNIFLTQASQYKPICLKSANLVFIMGTYLAALLLFLIKILRFHERKNS